MGKKWSQHQSSISAWTTLSATGCDIWSVLHWTQSWTRWSLSDPSNSGQSMILWSSFSLLGLWPGEVTLFSTGWQRRIQQRRIQNSSLPRTTETREFSPAAVSLCNAVTCGRGRHLWTRVIHYGLIRLGASIIIALSNFLFLFVHNNVMKYTLKLPLDVLETNPDFL